MPGKKIVCKSVERVLNLSLCSCMTDLKVHQMCFSSELLGNLNALRDKVLSPPVAAFSLWLLQAKCCHVKGPIRALYVNEVVLPTQDCNLATTSKMIDESINTHTDKLFMFYDTERVVNHDQLRNTENAYVSSICQKVTYIYTCNWYSWRFTDQVFTAVVVLLIFSIHLYHTLCILFSV